ncbi:uncharacterized protein I303_104539 [Kwoniella dejecticola CBS 10117]|uniref:Helicase SWR1 n=1 Tax=Kwoniella dejecticola CBS 10117 TaxID=1296121 RepID=A0A1A6A519_9TREE|nr:uncharacterized protein I303_04483 [Kwoniella dejecticola CBS 10117]OBR85151.1 hypothetical protein I303_04483 [Kwoniella dejecticola CBS 10117]
MSWDASDPSQQPSASSSTHDTTSAPLPTLNGHALTPMSSSRTLRTRHSDAGPSVQPTPSTKMVKPKPKTTSVSASAPGYRAATSKEISQITRRLGDENIKLKREEILAEREQELKKVLDGHDDAIREQFHLERFVTMITGWDPQAVKTDNSPAFVEWKEERHNLISLLPPTSINQSVSSQAGPSRPRQSLTARTTRRAAHEQSELFAHIAAPVAPSVNGHVPTKTSPSKVAQALPDAPPVSSKAKGKRRASEVESEALEAVEETPVRRKPGSKAKDNTTMPPPPLPDKKGKAARRATMGVTPVQEEAAEVKEEVLDPGGGKGKKRGRQSLPNLPAAKKTRGSKVLTEESPSESLASPQAKTPKEPTPVHEPSPTPTSAPLPSLAHLLFPPPPKRPLERFGPRRIWYTDPVQKPTALPKYDGNIASILESYNYLEDSGPVLDLKALENRAAKDGYYRARVMYLQMHGRLQRLIDEAENEEQLASGISASQKSSNKQIVRKTDHQDSLMSHMVQVRNAMLNEAKMKPIVCKRIARMIQVYWERINGKEERERLAEEKERKRLGKELVKGLRKRWSLAVKIIRAKLLEIQKIEQDRLGKEHLQNILQRSTGLLEAQVTGPEEEEGDEADSEENVSDATEDVSEAETSEAEEEQEQAEGHDMADEDGEIGVPPSSSAPPELAMEDGPNIDEVEGKDADHEDDVDEQGDGGDIVAEAEDDHQPNLRSLVDQGVNGDIAQDRQVQDDEAMSPGWPSLDDGFAAQEMVISHANEATEEPSLNHGTNGRHLAADVPASQSVHVPSPDALGISVADPATTLAPTPAPLDDLSSHVSDTHFDKPAVNGHHSPPRQPVIRSRRARTVKPPVPEFTDEDPDANDVEFTAAATSDLDDQDAELDVEMEDDDEEQERDSEDEGLLRDADVPIEELLKRYGYPPLEQDVPPSVEGRESKLELAVEIKDEALKAEVNGSSIAQVEDISVPSADIPRATSAATTDKSLLDDRLPEALVSPQLLVEGKRQRKVRSVWSPDHETPQHLTNSKRPKIQVVEDEDEEVEMTPELSSDEESGEGDSDDDNQESDKEGAEDGKPDVDEGPRVRQPFLLRGTLRPYQQAGLEWLASLWENGMNGILADEMGLGKTIQTISLLGHLACDKGIWGQHLIIVPTSVILNWEMEFKKFFPGMKVLTYYGNQKERKEKRVGWLTENTWQVCITSYQIVLADQHIFRRKAWCYMILDEAHNIKNFRSQRWQTLLGFKAQRRLLLTGTPLQNNLMELWSLLYFLMPGGIGADATAVVGFANHREFMEWFSNPMDKAIETGDAMDEETLATVSKLHTLLRPFILRRLKSEVETQLPGKFEHVVYCKLSKRQRFLYDEFMSRSSTKEALTTGGYLGVMNTLMQLRKVCNHPDLFEVRPVRTSFAMDSVARDYEPAELLLRKRLLAEADDQELGILSLGLGVTNHERESGWVCQSRHELDAGDRLPHAIEPIVVKRGKPPAGPKRDTRTVEGWLKYQAWAQEQASILRWRSLRDVNRRRCSPQPIYGSTFLEMLSDIPNYLLPPTTTPNRNEHFAEYRPPAHSLILSLPDRAKTLEPIIDLFAVIPPNVVARDMTRYALPGLSPSSHPSLTEESFDTLHKSTVKLQIAFPDSSLLQYDCGKLQTLYTMLRDLKAGGHRVLIFTQMTRVLDILEIFLSYNGHRYLRLDGSTKIEDRQVITERFNSDPKYFVFIASSRSGGVGINLTGADTVFFYDSDWNPSMDRQCMDRAHRIGQTREVHIYRFVSSHTLEENMLKKAEQKRMLDHMVIQQGEFNNDWWGRVGWKDMFGDVNGGDVDTRNDSSDIEAKENGDEVIDVDVEGTPMAEEVNKLRPRAGQERELARVLAEVEDEEDVQAARIAQNENELDFQEFDEIPNPNANNGSTSTKKPTIQSKVSFDLQRQRQHSDTGTPITNTNTHTPGLEEDFEMEAEAEDDGEDDGIGAVDEYMLKWVEEDWSYFITFRA